MKNLIKTLPQLISITESGNGNNLTLSTGTGAVMQYDNNGNITTQADKGITNIAYNLLNLPSVITTNNNQNASYFYRADGTKVKKIANGKTTEYLDGFQYVNGVLQFFATAEGYYDVANARYVYNYTDHLGNVRISFTKNTSGVAVVLEENNYYPFGLKHNGYNTGSTANDNYAYKYNGKELQENGQYDYGARFYMADIGRWGTVDPLAESYRRWSPYHYAVDNPIRYIDPDGRSSQLSWGQQQMGWTDFETWGYSKYSYTPSSVYKSLDAGASTGGSDAAFGNTQAYRNLMESVNAILNNPNYTGNYLLYRNDGRRVTFWLLNFSTPTDGTKFFDEEGEARNIQGIIGHTMSFETYLQKYGPQISVSNYNFGNNLYEPSFTRDFLEGFRNAPESNFGSLSAWAGYTGLNLNKYEALIKISAKSSSFSNLRQYSKSLNNLKSISRYVGIAGAIIQGIEGATDGNGLTAGDLTKVGIGLTTTFAAGALAPWALGYVIVDLGVGMVTGTTLTDRIGAGIDNTIFGR